MEEQLVAYVDPFTGVDGVGNCLCGPYLPLSIVRLGPDTLQSIASQATNGYRSQYPIIRFSHTHISGTGGGSRYGNIGVIPFTGYPRIVVGPYERLEEAASVGYYTVRLQPENIKVELTATMRTGIHRYFFPDNTQANIIIDAGSVIQITGGAPKIPGYSTGGSINGFIEITGQDELIGRGDFKGGWGHQLPYSVYFYAKFDAPFEEARVANYSGIFNGKAVDGSNAKAVLSFGKTAKVGLKIGISFVSIANARSHYEKEAKGKDFDVIKNEAESIWENTLNRIKVKGQDIGKTKLFYSLFTRLLCMPSDLGVDDEFPLWKSGVRHFSDFYCLWDSVRNANSLITLFAPELERDFLNCLLDIADHTGWLPDAWIAHHSACVQGGSSADILFCEAALKGIKGIDYNRALSYMRKNSEMESPDPYYCGRYGVKAYREHGFLPAGIANCVSRHLEYSYHDFCVGRLADFLGEKKLASEYYLLSKNLWQLWRDDLKTMAPKNPDGSWVNPFSEGMVSSYFYEGNSRQWTFNTHHDFKGLIQRFGGNQKFIEHLDKFFDLPERRDGGYRSKEIMLHAPFLYHYANRPDKSTDKAHYCLNKYFKLNRNGLSDCEDMGCQSAFYMCASLGLYPVMGQDIYLLTTPVFEEIEIKLGNTNKKLTIRNPDIKHGGKYIKKAKLNGNYLDNNWLRHGDLAVGGILELELSDSPGTWGTKNPPPSPI